MITDYENLKIGGQMYSVHRKYADENISGGQVIVCRVKSFENRGGEIMPILTEKGNSKRVICPKTHYLYVDLPDAINAIRTTNDR